MDQAKIKEAREVLKKVDDVRHDGMMWIWEKVAGSPQKAGWLALGLCVISFLLGRWSK